MKAIVLCAGVGTRLRPFTLTTAKHLIPVANKPVLFYGLEYLRAVGIRDVGIIVSTQSGPYIREAIGDGRRWGAAVTYIEQPEPRGLADAVRCAQTFVGDESFLMFLGDNIMPEGFAGLVQAFSGDVSAAVMLKPVDAPSAFGIAVVEHGRIVHLVEKPQQPPSNLAIVGSYVFTPEIFTSIARLAPSRRGEYEITDAIQDLIDRGFAVRAHLASGWWKDTGTADDILAANRAVLDEMQPDCRGDIDAASRVEGVAIIAAGAVIRHSHLIGPLIIGAAAQIEDATVGPHVSIGDNCRVEASTVRDTILMESAQVRRMSTPMEGSLIGRRAVVSGRSGLRLIVGNECRPGQEKSAD